MLGLERLVAPRVVLAHPHHRRACFLEHLVTVAEGAGFDGAAKRVILRIKIENDRASRSQVREREAAARVVQK